MYVLNNSLFLDLVTKEKLPNIESRPEPLIAEAFKLGLWTILLL